MGEVQSSWEEIGWEDLTVGVSLLTPDVLQEVLQKHTISLVP